MNNKHEVFAKEFFWKNYGTTPYYAERINVIKAMIPSDIKNILDIGCGKGDVINALLQNNPVLMTVGVDPFLEAIKYVNGLGVQAKLPRIPFADNYFDLVICLQVLEHLHDQDFFPSLLEIQRLSGKYVIIGVPYKENLQTLQVRCSSCGCKSHCYGHLRSFKKNTMINLFPDYIMIKSVLCGVKQHRSSVVGMLFKHHIANLYAIPHNFVCPYCFSNTPAASDRHELICRIAGIFNHVLSKLSPVMPYWIIALYKKRK